MSEDAGPVSRDARKAPDGVAALESHKGNACIVHLQARAFRYLASSVALSDGRTTQAAIPRSASVLLMVVLWKADELGACDTARYDDRALRGRRSQ